MSSVTHVSSVEGPEANQSGLRRGALGTPEIVANNIAECAPAIATFFVMGGIVAVSGVGTPLVVLIAGLAFFLHANVNAVFAKLMPSAGFYSTYTGRTFGTSTGAVVACGYLIGMMCFYVGVFFQVGVWTQTAVQDLFSFNLEWWIPMLVMEAIVTALLLSGVKVSVRAAILVFSFELTVLIIGAIAMLIHNSGSINLNGFDPGRITNGLSGFGLGFPLAIFLLLGTTGSSALAEEAREPRRSLPRAIRIATLAGVLIYVVMAWAEGIGFKNNTTALTSAAFPFVTGAENALGGLKYVMYLAGFTSAVGVMLATGNAGSHVLYNVSRERLAPSLFTHTHSGRKIPWNAILLPNCVLMAVTLIFGAFVGGENGFDYAVTLATDVLVVIFIVTNVALMVYGWRKLRPEGSFSWWVHEIIPAAGIAALGYPLYQAVKPSQPSPYDWFGVIIVGCYVIAFLYVYLRSRVVRLHLIGTYLADDEVPMPAVGGVVTTT